MKRTILAGILVLAAGASGLAAQQGQQKQAQQPPKGPAPKSQAEAQALQALGAAQGNPDATIKAAEDLITKFADTEFKDVALFMEAAAFQQKGDPDKAQIYAERTLETNPKQFQASLMLAELLTQRTRENDLDKEEKLTRADKYAADTIAMLKEMPKPNPGLTDEQWDQAKKDLVAEAHNAMGLTALTRKKYDVAASEFKTAMEGAAHEEPAYQVRLASAYQSMGKYEEAIALCDKVLANPQSHAQVKQVAQSVRAAAVKAGGKPAGAPAGPPGEVKKQ